MDVRFHQRLGGEGKEKFSFTLLVFPTETYKVRLTGEKQVFIKKQRSGFLYEEMVKPGCFYVRFDEEWRLRGKV